MSAEERTTYENGMTVRRQVLGDEHVDRATTRVTELDRSFQQWITENVWGHLWTDPTLDHRTRSMITVAILAALGREELALHVRASARTGVTDAELAQVLQHVAVYAGVPAANHAFAVAKAERPGGAAAALPWSSAAPTKQHNGQDES